MDRSLNKLKVAIIGCGRISVMHLVSIDMLKDVELVACCDVIKERADEVAKKYGCKAYYDYEEMLNTEKLDAVHVLLPHYLHSKVAIYAMQKGVNVLTEKPMDVDYQSAVNAVETADKLAVLYGVIFQCRYNNSAKLVKKAVESGKLGKIISARSTLTWKRDDGYYLGSDWKGTWDKEGGGVVIDQAIHSLDLVNWIIDSPIELLDCNMVNRFHKIVQIEDTAEGFVKYKNGATYSFYCMNNYGTDEPIEIRLFCENGHVIFGYDDAYIYYNDGTVEEAHQDENTVEYEGGKNYWGFQHERQIAQFYKAVRGEEELDISGKEALKTHKLICDLYAIGKKRMGIK